MQEPETIIPYFFRHMEQTYQLPQHWFEYFISGEGIERLVADFGRVRQEKQQDGLVDVLRFKAFDAQIKKALDNNSYEHLATIFLEYTTPKNARRLAADMYFKIAEREDEITELNATYKLPFRLGER